MSLGDAVGVSVFEPLDVCQGCSYQLYHQSINHGHSLYGRSGINNQIHFADQIKETRRITEIHRAVRTSRFGMINW
ncbi:hypothetical protein CY34DRAFT_810115 [Suillus luteus UH-Slu-Lm8-n1]|uniref:Uncharacterized protein n=1 Tax=Suillus luteus UH-Slu-Lm8-n1 TaxID=930992 RepID=A0A0D0B0Y2_9AGAM|nr:hypothetical protein CY34DRAFT_810115 [Suillus luteus UH-Slu-Lm8-n1]